MSSRHINILQSSTPVAASSVSTDMSIKSSIRADQHINTPQSSISTDQHINTSTQSVKTDQHINTSKRQRN
jgi:hypothetical protein